jgi:hypothetical protein
MRSRASLDRTLSGLGTLRSGHISLLLTIGGDTVRGVHRPRCVLGRHSVRRGGLGRLGYRCISMISTLGRRRVGSRGLHHGGKGGGLSNGGLGAGSLSIATARDSGSRSRCFRSRSRDF